MLGQKVTDHAFVTKVLDGVVGQACSHEGCTALAEDHEEIGFDFSPQKPMSVILGRYYIELIGPSPDKAATSAPIIPTAYGLNPEFLKEIEENINSLLPEPFKARVTS